MLYTEKPKTNSLALIFSQLNPDLDEWEIEDLDQQFGGELDRQVNFISNEVNEQFTFIQQDIAKVLASKTDQVPGYIWQKIGITEGFAAELTYVVDGNGKEDEMFLLTPNWSLSSEAVDLVESFPGTEVTFSRGDHSHLLSPEMFDGFVVENAQTLTHVAGAFTWEETLDWGAFSGYDENKTQALTHVSGTYTWVDVAEC